MPTRCAGALGLDGPAAGPAARASLALRVRPTAPSIVGPAAAADAEPDRARAPAGTVVERARPPRGWRASSGMLAWCATGRGGRARARSGRLSCECDGPGAGAGEAGEAGAGARARAVTGEAGAEGGFGRTQDQDYGEHDEQQERGAAQGAAELGAEKGGGAARDVWWIQALVGRGGTASISVTRGRGTIAALWRTSQLRKRGAGCARSTRRAALTGNSARGVSSNRGHGHERKRRQCQQDRQGRTAGGGNRKRTSPCQCYTGETVGPATTLSGNICAAPGTRAASDARNRRLSSVADCRDVTLAGPYSRHSLATVSHCHGYDGGTAEKEIA
ncbi:hypothetical protein GGX14DRAFT_633648 [Mycena pura]|uniref:Uncharacterized protein n=1 Tax=Mycena pura TaxID=153505 RepID=A0AAD6VE88_9AGAR|nr:hypothetical protein GGX14DRAFT_633648 [Mycena pura]